VRDGSHRSRDLFDPAGPPRNPVSNANAALTNPGGFTVNSQTFRIEAEGLIDGRPRANVTAIVQRRTSPAVTIVVLEWSGVR